MEMGALHLWSQMSFIAKAVVVVLMLLSVWSLSVCIDRLVAFRKARKQSVAFAKQFTELLRQDKVNEAIDRSRTFKLSHLARVTRAGLVQFNLEHAQHSLIGPDLVDAGRRAIERETLITHSDFKRGVPTLATIATTAPFIGLFGTVIGIINAFRGMAATGSGGIAAVSAGIAEALVTTALGLFVAIPAAWMFNHFTNILERFSVEMSNSGSELTDVFIKKYGGTHAVGARQ
jgi:biopolymer transport protein ExbB/biopolymer transport protein TolQ